MKYKRVRLNGAADFNILNFDLAAGGVVPNIITTHSGINKCLMFLAQHFTHAINVKQLPDVAGLSRRGFHKAFQLHIGMSPGHALRHARLEYAKRLLRHNDSTLRKIARASGFQSANTFCVAFRRANGMAPQEYRRNHLLPPPVQTEAVYKKR